MASEAKGSESYQRILTGFTPGERLTIGCWAKLADASSSGYKLYVACERGMGIRLQIWHLPSDVDASGFALVQLKNLEIPAGTESLWLGIMPISLESTGAIYVDDV